MFSSSASGKSISPSWTAAYVVGMSLIILVAATIGFLVFKEIREMKVPEDDAGWTIFQLGFEHQRLAMAAETRQSVDEIRLRGDIYLSRVLLVRDAPMLGDVRATLINDNLSQLFLSAQETDRLLSQLDTLGGRDALLHQLHSDAPMIRTLMMDMSNLNRKIQADRRAAQTQSLLFYLTALEVLLLALMAMGFVVLWITRKLRDAGRELAAQVATQNAILRSVDDAIIGLGADGAVLYSNPRAVALLGPSASGGQALTGGTAQPQGLVAEIRALAGEAAAPGAEGHSAQRKVHLKTEQGTRHYAIRTFPAGGAAPAAAPGPRSAALIVTITDVTAEEDAALRREEYDARIAEVSRLLAYAAISGGIVHEISQPLAAIRNYIYALKVSLNLKQGSEEHRAIADHLGEEIDRAIEVVRNVRRMGPQDPHDAGICNVEEAIAHSVRLVSLGVNPPPPITIHQPEEPAIVTGSLPMIGQVVVNLLKNALSASAAAGRPGAEVEVSIQGGQAEIMVSDFGTGVSADAAKSLFAPFSKSARGGMGLGLAICQRIASNLGGSLSWENRDGAGAVFKFTVPLAKEGSMP